MVLAGNFAFSAQALELPEHGIIKAYENCMVTSQGALWVNLLKNFFPEKANVALKDERVFFQGYKRPTIGKNHVDMKYRALFGADEMYTSAGIDFRYETKDGKLKMSLRRSQNSTPIELEEIYIPFYKYDREETDLEVLNKMGEVKEYTLNVAKEAQSYSYEKSAPVTLKNAKTNKPLSNESGSPFQFDRAKFLSCIKEQVNKSAVEYSITQFEGYSPKRESYIRSMEQMQRNYTSFSETPKSDLDWVEITTQPHSSAAPL